jgi:hypothetical protein
MTKACKLDMGDQRTFLSLCIDTYVLINSSGSSRREFKVSPNGGFENAPKRCPRPVQVRLEFFRSGIVPDLYGRRDRDHSGRVN